MYWFLHIKENEIWARCTARFSMSTDNHYISLLVPAFKAYADKPIIRPALDETRSWGQVTFREWDQQLAAARLHWIRTLPASGIQPTDVVGLW